MSKVKIDLTTEVRWFFDDPLPPEMLAWFTHGGEVGLREDRCDSYRVQGPDDVGVKQRGGATLELKLRLGQPQPFTIAVGVAGQLEVWQRWSPADRHVDADGDTTWVDVEKMVVKRRFDADGNEVTLTAANRELSGNGCDAEVVAVTVRGRTAWSLAFAAFGTFDDHQRFLHAAWDSLFGDRPMPRPLHFEGASMLGYPQWLSSIGARRPAER